MTSSEATVIEVEPARMSVIKKTNAGEKKAYISEAELRGNITVSGSNRFGVLEGNVLGLSKLYWVMMGAIGGALGVLVVLLCMIKCLCKTNNENQNTPSGTTIINNTVVTSQPDTPTKPSRSFRNSFRKKRRGTEEIPMENPPTYAEAEKDVGDERALENKGRKKTLAEQRAALLL